MSGIFHKNNSAKKRRILIFIVGTSILIVFFNIFQRELKGFFYLISSPIQKVFWQAGVKTYNFLEIFIRAGEREKRIDYLEKENQRLRAETAALKELEKENQELKKALDLGIENDFKLFLVQIIGKEPSQDIIFVNKGNKDGVLKGMPAITAEKILAGKVVQSYENFSKVMLLSNKKFSFPVKIQDSNNDISGVGKGEGDYKILISFVPKEEKVAEGDLVISDSLGGIFPRGFLIGRVASIERKDVEPFQKIEVKPDFDIRKTSDLFIITARQPRIGEYRRP
jgi:rod shape-determining protein MreC